MEAWLRSQGLWRIISGSQKRPKLKLPSPSKDNTTAESATAAAQAELLEAKTLELQDAWDAKSDRPKDFDLKALDKELTSMVLIRAVPDEYSHFVSSLLLMDKLDKDTVHQAFLTEEIQRRRRAADAVSVTAMAAASAPLQCEFCSRPGHAQSTCRTFARAQENARKQAASGGTWKQRQGPRRLKRPLPPSQLQSLQAMQVLFRISVILLPSSNPKLTSVGTQTQAAL
ncbi:hypothetical protein EST38_g9290 [Candolleomyces aberdarensis]|uniref:Uncharacterized protein n=1 Tax=Candolleomyces aberdarensis TaxID=2316362 RepID=A0A4Q2DAA1_9AGAR|nr:hypothetical protein EST38_g9290 [Candolleomyces aberdarensis]